MKRNKEKTAVISCGFDEMTNHLTKVNYYNYKKIINLSVCKAGLVKW